jgi:MFS family permease
LGLSKQQAAVTFAVISLTGPVLGVIIGGVVFSKIGGYNSPGAYPLAVFIISAGGCCGFPMAFMSNFWASATLLWIQFFCGGFCMPVLTGILLNTCPASLRAIANAIANLVYNLLGKDFQ